MPFTAVHSAPQDPDYMKQDQGFFCMSATVDDFSYSPSEAERSRDAEQFVATGRTSWKNLQGKGEAVWPPFVEAALFEALEKYKPGDLDVSHKVHKTAERFPMRNKFISDYIFQNTGRRRTPKQVGSRLQQLRKTSKMKRILHVISQGNTPELTPASSQVRRSPGISSPPPDTQAPKSFSGQSVVYIEIALQRELCVSPIPSISLVGVDSTTSQSIQLALPATPQYGRLFQPEAKPWLNNLPFLCGSVLFPSPTALMPQSCFLVYEKESNVPVHAEAAPLQCISSPIQSPGWLYISDLVPSFWRKLCLSQDASQYTIVQTLEPMNFNRISGLSSSTRNIVLVYNFSSIARPSQNLPNGPPSTHLHTSISNLCTLTPDSYTMYPTWQYSQHECLDVTDYFHDSAFTPPLDSLSSISLPSVRSQPFSFPSPAPVAP